MSAATLWALAGLGLGVVVIRRRTGALALLAAQSLLLGVAALHDAHGTPAIAAIGLLVRAVALPALLLWVVRSTREPRRVGGERFALVRLIAAITAVGAAWALSGRGSVALVVLGIAVVALRRPLAFQAAGFLLAENGVYAAGLSAHGGLPGAIELALLFDLVVVIAVAATFGMRIHEQFGTGDTGVLRELHD